LRQKTWGKKKIEAALKNKFVSTFCINEALNQLDEIEYIDILTQEVLKIREKEIVSNEFETMQKVLAKLARKGFETDLVIKIYKEHFQ